jgi:hypothetical protein
LIGRQAGTFCVSSPGHSRHCDANTGDGNKGISSLVIRTRIERLQRLLVFIAFDGERGCLEYRGQRCRIDFKTLAFDVAVGCPQILSPKDNTSTWIDIAYLFQSFWVKLPDVLISVARAGMISTRVRRSIAILARALSWVQS